MMEVVQGKSTDRKIIIAQEIAFAKVLAGNNKALRDRGVKKLKKWLTARGSGKWVFTEDEFLRIWTGLFYCMWMSDKFLVQEELAESISQLIHCFKKNSESALLFIKCFNKRLLMEWDGLDQYRVDKFNMLIRRFLRQSFVYCKRKHWDESLLKELMEIFYDVVLHRDNSLGYVLHFINIYAEELAKVGKGKLQNNTVLTFFEPFVKLIASTRDARIRNEAENLFHHLIRQSDIGIEFEEQLDAWKQHGFPGTGPQCMKKDILSGRDLSFENGKDSFSDEEEEEEETILDDILDPRAGSVNVVLPQIPLDLLGIINLFKKYEKARQTNSKGKKLLRSLTQKFLTVKKRRYPLKIKKDPILDEKVKKKRHSVKTAKELLEFTKKLDEGPIKTKELKKILRELEEDEDLKEGEEAEESSDNVKKNEIADDGDNNTSDEEFEKKVQELIKHKKSVKVKTKKKASKKKNNFSSANDLEKNEKKAVAFRKEEKILNGIKQSKDDEKNSAEDRSDEMKSPKTRKKILKKKAKNNCNSKKEILKNEENEVKSVKTLESLNNFKSKENQLMESFSEESKMGHYSLKSTPMKKTGIKRKILSTWQVQDLDTNSPEYLEIVTPKIIQLERKMVKTSDSEENQEPEKEKNNLRDNEWKSEEGKMEILPVFWEKARAKVNKNRNSKGNTIFENPFAGVNGESKSPRGDLKRISFALDRNMAQENDEYLEEVRNSPKIPFDGSKKPVQSALKSGLSPSPVNPFYRFKKIKF